MTSTPQETEIQQLPHPPPPPPPSPKADQEAEFHEPTSSATVTEESQPTDHPPASDEETKKWGTHVMGPPSAPNVHPDNQQAALWMPFQEWGKNADTVARNIWHNLKTGPSVPQAAWGKVNLTAKAITEGGFESLFKHIFETDSNEKLKKTFACYLSTSTGPVAGTLYLSTARVAFCSDRPLCHTAPSGEEAWSYYKVMIPLEKISTVNSEIMTENPSRKYIQIVTTDEHDFWFMGFVNFEKALQNLSESVSSFKEAGSAIQPVVAKHTTLGCKMEKGGGNGFSLPSKEPKSSLKSSFAKGKDDSNKGRKIHFESEGNLSKGGKGGNIANGGKSPMTKEPPPLELKIESELPQNAKPLMDCEAAQILQGIQDQMVLLSRDPTIKLPVSFDKGLQYAKTGARYTNPQSVGRVLEDLRKHGVSDGEISLIANVFPETADEAFALVPSLKSKARTLREPLKDILGELAKFSECGFLIHGEMEMTVL
ncbi:hypothetical protein DKX38_023336 [Salix brachista]|uniref:GRAM domain-containing protein n=1 Tax=Salix brachista TaxID=2182728 RepID=A0A5N5JWE9_9ROSI|nr:hypothetical protein DKX38_023336 [Salix brachista]